ncbi:hypothetical protein ACA910_002615 [Epithemia clementina (nom. ined.)]
MAGDGSGNARSLHYSPGMIPSPSAAPQTPNNYSASRPFLANNNSPQKPLQDENQILKNDTVKAKGRDTDSCDDPKDADQDAANKAMPRPNRKKVTSHRRARSVGSRRSGPSKEPRPVPNVNNSSSRQSLESSTNTTTDTGGRTSRKLQMSPSVHSRFSDNSVVIQTMTAANECDEKEVCERPRKRRITTDSTTTTTTLDASLTTGALSSSTAQPTTTTNLSSTFFNEVMMRSVQKQSLSSSCCMLAGDEDNDEDDTRNMIDGFSGPSPSLLPNNTKLSSDHEASSTNPPVTPQQQRQDLEPSNNMKNNDGNPKQHNKGPQQLFHTMDAPKPVVAAGASPAALTADSKGGGSFSTPAGKTATASSTTLFTPEGFQMLKYINQAEDSPFQSNIAGLAHETGSANPLQEQQQQTKLRRPEWYQLELQRSSKATAKQVGDPMSSGRVKELNIPLLDWSLKDQVTIEFQGLSSVSSTNHLLSLFLGRSSTILQQARQQPQTTVQSHRNKKGEMEPAPFSTTNHQSKKQEALQQWASSLLYFQYPASDTSIRLGSIPSKKIFAARSSTTNNIHLNTSSSIMMKGNTNTNSTSNSIWKGEGDTMASRSRKLNFPDDVRSRQSAETLLLWKDAANHGPQQHHHHRQQHEDQLKWQDAFWSLYGNWRMAVQQLLKNDIKTKEDCLLSLEDITQTCFYAFGPGHSVLFRVGLQRSQDNNNANSFSWNVDEDEDSDDDSFEGCDVGCVKTTKDKDDKRRQWNFVPEVVFSSSSIATRNQLRQMGATLRFLQTAAEKEGKKDVLASEFSDEEPFWTWLNQPVNDTKAENAAAAATSPSIQAELVALRRAQAMGQTVGADIMVKTKKNQPMAQRRRPRTRDFPPLVVAGDSDCASFAELYLNWCGLFESHEEDGSYSASNLPVLICRPKVGPFLHSSTKELRVQRLSRPGCLGMHIQGFVMPCALRAIMQAIGNVAQATEQQRANSFEKENRTTSTIAAHFRVHKGCEQPSSSVGHGCSIIGGPSTCLFNGGPWLHYGGNDPEHCACRQRLSCQVGDIAIEGKITLDHHQPCWLLSIKVDSHPTLLA